MVTTISNNDQANFSFKPPSLKQLNKHRNSKELGQDCSLCYLYPATKNIFISALKVILFSNRS